MLQKLLSCLTVLSLYFSIISSPTSAAKIHNDFREYRDEFINLAKIYKKDIKFIQRTSIKYGSDLGPGVLAHYIRLFNEITVDKREWSKLSYLARKQLIIHEMGHALGIDHTPPVSIMQAENLIPDRVFALEYDLLINQLFNTKQTLNKKVLRKTNMMNNKHAVIKFSATWCPPCKALAPVFDEVAAAHPEVVVYRIDVDENQDIAKEYGVRGIPMMIKIKDGKIEDTKTGNQSKEIIEEMFK